MIRLGLPIACVLVGCASASTTPGSPTATTQLEVTSVDHVVDEPLGDFADDDMNQPPYLFHLPLVSGGAPGVAERINGELTFDELRGLLGGMTSGEFEVTLRKGHYLGFRISASPPCGAYCSEDSSQSFLFDTTTGRRIPLDELFARDQLPALRVRVEAVRKDIAQRAYDALDAAAREELTWFPDVLDTYFGPDSAIAGSLWFSDKGITFETNYDFPHYAKSAEPDWPSLTWAELAPYLAPAHRSLAD